MTDDLINRSILFPVIVLIYRSPFRLCAGKRDARKTGAVAKGILVVAEGSGSGGGNDAVGILPMDTGGNILSHRGIDRGRYGVVRDRDLVDRVAQPGSTLTVGAIHKGIADVDVGGVTGFDPQTVEKLVVRDKGAFKLGVVAALTVAEGDDLHPFEDLEVHVPPVDPGERLKFLYAILGGVGDRGIARIGEGHTDHLARRGVHLDVGGELNVGRQLQTVLARRKLGNVVGTVSS